MFESLSQRLTKVFDGLRRRGIITQEDLDQALREIRISLLEADVALPVVRDFIDGVRDKALGQEVIRSVSPAQMIVKIVHAQLIEALGAEDVSLNLNHPSPMGILMVGLQGSGKTSTASKIALYLQEKLNKKVLLASLDVYRPAAQKQLEILAIQIGAGSLEIIEGQQPFEIAKRAQQEGRTGGYDVVIYDTAGRLQLDEALMKEAFDVQKFVQPVETIFVLDALMGQDALNVARGFHERLTLTGLALTRIDGDGRGGAALSGRHITGCPIKFLGTGERPHQFELFDAARLADRILDMGDIVSLVERASQVMQQEDTEKLEKQLKKGHFNLDDMANHLQQMLKMGGLSSLVSMLPGAGKIKDQLGQSGVDDRMIRRQVAIIQSMTPKERRNHTILNASRKRRVAGGAGMSVMEVNRLLKQFEQMQTVMKKMSKMGPKSLLRSGLGALFGR